MGTSRYVGLFIIVAILKNTPGAISLEDTLLIGVAARLFISDNFAQIRKQLKAILKDRSARVSPPLYEQPVISYDMTSRTEGTSAVYLRTSYIPDALPRARTTVLVEVYLQAGRVLITKTIPFQCDLAHFGISL